jgi:hypothetical protein
MTDETTANMAANIKSGLCLCGGLAFWGCDVNLPEWHVWRKWTSSCIPICSLRAVAVASEQRRALEGLAAPAVAAAVATSAGPSDDYPNSCLTAGVVVAQLRTTLMDRSTYPACMMRRDFDACHGSPFGHDFDIRRCYANGDDAFPYFGSYVCLKCYAAEEISQFWKSLKDQSEDTKQTVSETGNVNEETVFDLLLRLRLRLWLLLRLRSFLL